MSGVGVREVATGKMRWTECEPPEGDHKAPATVKLQMEWEVDVYLGGDDGWGRRIEWRDVPFMDRDGRLHDHLKAPRWHFD